MSDILNAIKIRAHHLMCLQGFQGLGYDCEFTKNLAKIIEEIEEEDTVELEIISECDAICSCCPQNNDGRCQKRSDSQQKVKNTDIRVLGKLDLKEGKIGRAKDFLSLANTKLKSSSDAYDICSNCDWTRNCLWFISRSKQ